MDNQRGPDYDEVVHFEEFVPRSLTDTVDLGPVIAHQEGVTSIRRERQQRAAIALVNNLSFT